LLLEHWQAPQQFFESAPLTHKADVYSLGNVLFFLLTGRTPFFSMSSSKAEEEIRKGKHPEIDASILNSKHPFHVSLRKAIEMCMVFDPEERTDARSVAAFLRKALADYNRTAIS
jgi:serine/threonine protein kinase